MTGLEDELLAIVRLENRQIVVVDDAMARHAVLDGAVRELDRDRVAGLESIDVRERRAVRRSVSRDVDELALSRHERLTMPARPAPQVARIRPVDDNDADPEPRNP